MQLLKNLFYTVALVSIVVSTKGDTIYNDYGSQNGNAFNMGNGQEIGNQITIGSGAWTSWSLTNFSIMYYTPAAFLASNVGIRVQFYENDGPLTNLFNMPGTRFFDSGWFYNTLGGGLPGTNGYPDGYHSVYYNSSDFYGGSVLNLTGPYLTLPSTFTFTITFTNLGGTNIVYLPLATNTPSISAGDYWVNDGSGNWSLQTNATSAANFIVDFSGTVPEPATYGMAALGGALLLLGRLRNKR